MLAVSAYRGRLRRRREVGQVTLVKLLSFFASGSVIRKWTRTIIAASKSAIHDELSDGARRTLSYPDHPMIQQNNKEKRCLVTLTYSGHSDTLDASAIVLPSGRMVKYVLKLELHESKGGRHQENCRGTRFWQGPGAF